MRGVAFLHDQTRRRIWRVSQVADGEEAQKEVHRSCSLGKGRASLSDRPSIVRRSPSSTAGELASRSSCHFVGWCVAGSCSHFPAGTRYHHRSWRGSQSSRSAWISPRPCLGRGRATTVITPPLAPVAATTFDDWNPTLRGESALSAVGMGCLLQTLKIHHVRLPPKPLHVDCHVNGPEKPGRRPLSLFGSFSPLDPGTRDSHCSNYSLNPQRLWYRRWRAAVLPR